MKAVKQDAHYGRLESLSHNAVRRLLPVLLSLAALTLFALYLARNAHDLKSLLALSGNTLGGLLILSILTLVGNGLINLVLYRALDVELSLEEATGLAAVNSLANHLPFSGGILAKAAYLLKRYNLNVSHFLGATTALYVTFVAASGLIGFTTYSLLILRGHYSPSYLLLAAFALMFAVIGVFGLPLSRISVYRLRAAASGWTTLMNRRDTLSSLIAIHVAMIVIFAVRYGIAFHALSQDVSIAHCLLFSAGSVLTQLVSITPGGLGIREGIVGAISAILGFDPGIAVVAVALDRLVATTVIIAGGVISTYFLSKKATLSSQELVSQMPVEDVKTP